MADLVSVIVPVYNAEETIKRCVDSLLNQSYKEIQIVLVDDGSKDRSLPLCEKFAKEDTRVLVVKKENGGVSSARNYGIEQSRGKYIMFLDSDDWFEESMVEHYVRLMREHDASVVIGGLQGTYADNPESFIKSLPVYGKKDTALWNVICDSSEMFGYIGGKLFRKDIVDTALIRFNEKMYAQEDLDFCLSYYAEIDTFYLTDYVGYCYYYEQGKRVPPFCDFMRNQLKLLSIAEKKCELTANSYKKIQQRICGYVYVMLYSGKSREDVLSACEQMESVEGLAEYLQTCTLQGEKKQIVSWYLKGKDINVYRYFKVRRLIRRILGRA